MIDDNGETLLHVLQRDQRTHNDEAPQGEQTKDQRLGAGDAGRNRAEYQDAHKSDANNRAQNDRVSPGESGVAGSEVSAALGEGGDDASKVEAAASHLDVFGGEQIGAGDLAIHQHVEVGQPAAHDQPQKEREEHEHREGAHVLPVVIPVKAADGLA